MQKYNIDMINYQDSTYIYNSLTKDLYVISKDGRFQKRPDIDRVVTDSEINFSSVSRCFGGYDVYDAHLPIKKCQIYDEQSQAYQTASGNWYSVDWVEKTISGKEVPNGKLPFIDAYVTENCCLRLDLAGDYSGKYLQTTTIQQAMPLAVYRIQDLENSMRRNAMER